MADWRQDDSKKAKPKPNQSPKPKSAPPQLSPPPTGGWKGRGAAVPSSKTPPKAERSQRSWSGQVATEAGVSGSAMRRWLAVGVLFISAVVLTVGLVVYAFWKPPLLQVVAFSVGEYSAPELLENPYGNFQRQAMASLDNININFLTSEINGNDNALSDLSTVDWIDSFDAIRSKTLPPSGPDGRVTLFYISSFARFDAENNLFLLSQTASPFAPESDSSSQVALSNVLASIAQSVKRNHFAWIVLDVQLPSVVSNLGDLDPQWETAGENALRELEPSLQERLIVTLPGGNGQQNWMAPEFSGSFLGHHLRQLLEGRNVPQSMLSKELTIGQFRDLLNERVGRDARNRRYAVQQPAWLPEANLSRAASIQAVRLGSSASGQKPQATVVQANLKKIEELWAGLRNSAFQKPYRWDPLGYAMIESQLLSLEDIAFNQLPVEQFQKTSNLVERSIRNLQTPQVEFDVSLIENQIRDRYFRDGTSKYGVVNELARRLARELPVTDEKTPAFWRKPPVDEKEAEQRKQSPTAEEQLSDNEKAHLIWQFFVACAQSNDRNIWEEAFQVERMRSAIAFATPAAKKWMEINLLSRFVEDIDWSIPNLQSSEACARLILNFDRLQRIACQPDPEISWWWLRDQHSLLEPVETQFLRSIDHCLAGEFSTSLDLLDQVVARLPSIEQRLSDVQHAIATTQEALHATPHLLAWLLKEFQFAPEQEMAQIESQLKNLALIANATYSINELLSSAPGAALDTGLNPLVADLTQRLDEIQLAFSRYVDTETSSQESAGANDNPLPFRRSRIALLSPMLQLDARARLHENTSQFLALELTGGDEEKGVAQERSARQGGEVFLREIKQEAGKWRMIIDGDGREKLTQLFDGPPPVSSTPLQLRTALWKQEYWQRVFAPAFGHCPTLQARLASASRTSNADRSESFQWPWSAPWQRWNLAMANDRLFHVERLANSQWGNGLFDDSTSPEKFYFFQLASQLKLPTGFSNLDPARQYVDNFQGAMQRAKDQAVQRIKSLRAQFGEPNQVIRPAGEQRAPVQVVGDLTNGIAQVFLGSPSRRLPWQRDQNEGAWVVDLSQVESRSTAKNFDVSYWQSTPPLGTLLFRGNARSAPINWKVDDSKQESVELTLVQQPAADAMLRVVSPEAPDITVLLLVDCSDSMSTQVKFAQEGRVVEGELFELVKDSVIGVVKKLATIHNQREAVVQVALVPFGLNRQDVVTTPILNDMLDVGKDNFYKSKRRDELDGNWQADLELAIRALKASGDTPLYDAITFAANQARPNEKTLIYVFSDGVNYINPGSTQQIGSKTEQDVRRAVKQNKQIRLSIFHFDYFEQWIAQKVPDLDDREFWRQKKTEGIKQLKGLENLGSEQYGYYLSDEGPKLMQESLDSIPRARVKVASLSSSGKAFETKDRALGEEIYVPAEYLPAELNIEVERPFNTKCSLTVQVLGGEKLYLPYNRQGTFEFEEFKLGGKLRVGIDGSRSGGGLSSQLFVRKLQDRVLSQKVLGFELHFANANKTLFTRRPAWVIAEVTRSDDPTATTYVLADRRFKTNTHYPEANMSDVPWSSSRQPARLRVWAADDIPPQVTQLTLAANEPHEPIQLGIAKVQFSAGERIVAKVEYSSPPRPQDRVVIVCPKFLSAKRTFDQNTHTESHEFEISEESGQSSIQITTIGSLEEAAKASSVSQFVFDQISVGG